MGKANSTWIKGWYVLILTRRALLVEEGVSHVTVNLSRHRPVLHWAAPKHGLQAVLCCTCPLAAG